MMVMGLSVALTLWGAGIPTLHPPISSHLIEVEEALGVATVDGSRCAEVDLGIVPWHSLAVPSSGGVEGVWPGGEVLPRERARSERAKEEEN